jgi:phosphoribosyl-dephospho-CoA transferase
LSQLRPTLDNLGLVWGVSGSAGFELASGIAALHQGSDLDLILRTPTPLSRVDAGHILHLLDSVTRPVDMQLQTPAGAVALREWAGVTLRVLLKCAEGACLVADPWAVAEQAA